MNQHPSSVGGRGGGEQQGNANHGRLDFWCVPLSLPLLYFKIMEYRLHFFFLYFFLLLYQKFILNIIRGVPNKAVEKKKKKKICFSCWLTIFFVLLLFQFQEQCKKKSEAIVQKLQKLVASPLQALLVQKLKRLPPL